MEPNPGSGSSGSVSIAGSAGSVPNGSGFRFPVRFLGFLLVFWTNLAGICKGWVSIIGKI